MCWEKNTTNSLLIFFFFFLNVKYSTNFHNKLLNDPSGLLCSSAGTGWHRGSISPSLSLAFTFTHTSNYLL